jgi:acetyl-CoA C-acetyltransferase
MTKKVAVIGAYCTKFGELWEKRLSDLLFESSLGALRDAGITPATIDAIVTGNMCSGMLGAQLQLGALASSLLHTSCPSVVVEATCASGAMAVYTGIEKILSGNADVVLVNGVEKMTDHDGAFITQSLMSGAHVEAELMIGATFPALNALVARLYMHTYGVTKEHLAAVSVYSHKNATHNPIAHFKKEISLSDVLSSEMVADPLSVFDCAPISDGAASVVLCSEYYAKSHGYDPIFIVGWGSATDTVALASRASLLSCNANRLASGKAYTMAGITPHDIDIAEVHDAFSITHVMALEDLGFYPQGKAGFVFDDILAGKKSCVVSNPSGGLKARGHPAGASGVAQLCEIVWQLRGNAGGRQVVGARYGLTQSMGGCGTNAVVHILSKGDLI